MQTHQIGRRALLGGAGLLTLGTLVPTTRLWAHPAFASDPFALGVAAGDPLPDGFVIWTRLAPKPLEEHGGMPMAAVAVAWEVAEDSGFKTIARSGDAIAPPELAHSVHVEVTGLRPGRRYWYRFRTGVDNVSNVGTAMTAPAAGALPSRLKIGVAGCQHYEAGFFTAYRHLSQEPDLDLIYHYGDYIYEGKRRRVGGDAPIVREHAGDEIYSLDDYRRRYAQYKSDPDLIAAHAAAAFASSFDDHEIDNNWAANTDQDGTAPALFELRRAVAMQAWYEHMPVRAAQFPRAGALRMFRRLDYGSLLRMHVLDTRSYRNEQLCGPGGGGGKNCVAQDDPARSILGAEQERWLTSGLNSPARWNLLAQQVLIMPFDQREDGASEAVYGKDSWNGYPDCRKRLVKAITDRKLTNVVIATGDAHQHFVGSVPRDDRMPEGPAAASEFLTSSISSGGDGNARRPTQKDVLKHNPNMLLLNNQRGYQLFDIHLDRWDTHVKVVDAVQTRGAPVRTLARYVVDPKQPGPQLA
ncbi:alkaline phosphatase D family protein [Sphingomonas sp. M1-B02]|uniref:alkaline phosphatase D family protein n=1 Tax=Sphingomonas sp. M1-B02 TaxID=3114300 RepID=UPI0022409C2A|nr:alkaline phosphatase D family protein [Sphingomonas sp. S6-11]UZK67788.1 alkaline phosphatase D family protein [Sphingomonas sp. S6-11]